MVNQTKIYEVENLKALLKESKSAALVDYQGLKAEQIRQLRQEIKEKGGLMTVAKNTLLFLALKQLGIELTSPLVGPTALITAQEDEVAPLKVVNQAKQQWEKPEFKLGLYQGKILSPAELSQLLTLPEREVLLTQLIGGINSPLVGLIRTTRYPLQQLIFLIKTIKEKREKD